MKPSDHSVEKIDDFLVTLIRSAIAGNVESRRARRVLGELHWKKIAGESSIKWRQASNLMSPKVGIWRALVDPIGVY